MGKRTDEDLVIDAWQVARGLAMCLEPFALDRGTRSEEVGLTTALFLWRIGRDAKLAAAVEARWQWATKVR